jgi:sugar/nucleoside kinase (ribokinase family)
MVTYAPPAVVDPALVQRLAPRAVVAGAGQHDVLALDLPTYAVVGDAEAEMLDRGLTRELESTRAVLLNAAEALRITGATSAEDAAVALAERVETVVVSCGADGAVAANGGKLFTSRAPAVDARDTTGAGDLLVAAYVQGDLAGLPLAARLQRAVVYAALSVRTATGAMSAATFEELERALAELTPVEPEPLKEAS